MKKYVLFALLLIASASLFAQNTSYNPAAYDPIDNMTINNIKHTHRMHYAFNSDCKFGVGIQYLYPVGLVSLKYAISSRSVIEALVSPTNLSALGYNYSFYGARYNYRFKYHARGPLTITYPYLFGSAGYDTWDYSNNGKSKSFSSVAFLAGAGYEVIFDKHYGFSFELGYGNLTSSNGFTGSTEGNLVYGAGLHYYFTTHKRVKTEEENTMQEEKEGGEHTDDGDIDAGN